MADTKIVEIYKSILSYLGLEADNNGNINAVMGEKKEPVILDGLRLALPTTEQLRNYNKDKTVIFHPLLENILQSESKVIDKMKNIINIKLNYTIGIVVQSLLNIVASPELHSKLTPEQAEILIKIKDADEKTVLTFINIMLNGIKSKANNLFTNIYLRRGGVYKNKKYSRAGIVMFPFYNDLLEDKVDKIRVKDKEAYKAIFEFIFPELTDNEAYNYGSNSNVAPYIDALLMTSMNLAARLNDIIITYKDYIDEADDLLFSSQWKDYFDNLEQMMPEIRKVPMQYGNDGNIFVENIEEKPVSSPVQNNMPQYHQQPMPPQYPQQQFQQPQQPVLKRTSRGLDFKSVMQANPTLAYNNNVMAPLINNQIAARNQGMMQPYPNQGMPMMPGYPNMNMPMQPYPNQGMPMMPGYLNPNMPMQPYPNQGMPMMPGYPNMNMPMQPYPNQGMPMMPGYPNMNPSAFNNR